MTTCAFERTSKRRRGYPSEHQVKTGSRVVHGGKELLEKLGANDLCPCGSGRRFQALLPQLRALRRRGGRRLLSAIATEGPMRGPTPTGYLTLTRREHETPPPADTT
jgi:hypothetical protein